MTEINFNKVGSRYESDVIEADKEMIAIQIVYKSSGETDLYRSINGTDWTIAEGILGRGNTHLPVFEFNVTSIVVGQKLKIVFQEGVEPTKINLI